MDWNINTKHMGGKVDEWWDVKKQQNKYIFNLIILAAAIIAGGFYYFYLLQKVDELFNNFNFIDLLKSLFYLIIGAIIFSPIVRTVCRKLSFIPFNINYHVSDNEWNKIRLKRLLVYMCIGIVIFFISYVFLKLL